MVIRATSVAVIGGPTGPVVGATGPSGLQGHLLATGPTGSVGPIGALGSTGSVGIAGLALLLFGATGRTGPLGSDGYPGPTGPFGSLGIVPPDRFAYFENTSGLLNFGPTPVYVGCKFIYTPHYSGLLLILFSGLAKNTADKITSATFAQGVGSAPNAGTPGFGVGFGGNAKIHAPNLAIPFMLMVQEQQGSIGTPLWFDLSVRSGTSSFDPSTGTVKDISCIVMEL